MRPVSFTRDEITRLCSSRRRKELPPIPDQNKQPNWKRLSGWSGGILVLFFVLVGCTTLQKQKDNGFENVPETVAEAALMVKNEWLSPSEKEWLLRNPSAFVAEFYHLTLGLEIRNRFGLWRKNSQLLQDCGVEHPDECSGLIIEKVWQSVRAEADKKLVHNLDCQFQILEQINISYKGYYQLTLGEILDRLQEQITQQQAWISPQFPECSQTNITFQVLGDPDLDCYARIEFSEDGREPVSFDMFLSLFCWRNNIKIKHSPPSIELHFLEKCAWPEIPTQFMSLPSYDSLPDPD